MNMLLDKNKGTARIGAARTVAARANTAENLSCDVVIAGCGVAGLYTALNLPASMRVLLLAKTTVDECDSMLAQGGICVQYDEGDYDAFFEDTMRAGHYENRTESVDQMIRGSRAVIDDLLRLGVDFDHTTQGDLAYTREGAHSRARICFHADTTGAEITTKLLAEVRRRPNISIREHTEVVDILTAEARGNEARATAGAAASGRARAALGSTSPGVHNEACVGVVCLDHEAGQTFTIEAAYTVLATGGIGGQYARSTNYPCLTGDACRIAANHGIALQHMDYVQIHPTSLYSTKPGRAFLISESCRGEGAVLLNAAGERFTDELQPRDVVANAIYDQMKKDGTPYVWLSFENVPAEEITGHFVAIRQHCLEEGYDILREPIPVVPAQHYFMGGVWVDQNSQTTMPHLYAVGETSCNGVHGRNRLASNSLLEALVFARAAADAIIANAPATNPQPGCPGITTQLPAEVFDMRKKAC